MIKILEKWQKTISETSEQIENVRRVFNCVECDVLNSFERLQVEYTEAIASEVGDSCEWLLWYWLENDMGALGFDAGYHGNTKPITGLSELEALIIDGKKTTR
ncbi:MAG: hypothetical protein U5M23_01425 [Marinagarivorans sp.]|nr:hypothetical protein [Marinagarivorans sp.]